MTITCGPQPSDVLIVGEAPGAQEERLREPFVGASGKEFTKMLHEAGFIRTECRITNVTSTRPPGNDISHFFRKKSQLRGNETYIMGRYCTPEIARGLEELKAEIETTRPKLIIALGDTALWALTGESGITKWRGSILRHESGAYIIPTYHPAAILRMWQWRFIAVQDLRRAHRQLTNPVLEPEWNHITSTSFQTIIEVLHSLRLRLDSGEHLHLACDIETRSGHIDCIGIAWTDTDAICIPFMSYTNPSLFPLDEEARILSLLRAVLMHENALVIGQNFLYDASYFAKHYGWFPIPSIDTMIAHAVLFPGLPKSLDFLSSLYLPFHRYWKDENKEANAKVDDLQRWVYNCRDCCATYAIAKEILPAIESQNLQRPLQIEMDLFEPIMYMMMRGVRIDTSLRSEYAMALMDAQAKYEQWFINVTANVWDDVQLVKSKSAKPWYNSPTQQQKIFYQILGLPIVRNRKTGRPTADDEALKKIMSREPILIPLCENLLAYRSVGVFYSTFINARLDADSRIRTAYNPVGTETFRFNSKIDAFGSGMNLQNIPKGDG